MSELPPEMQAILDRATRITHEDIVRLDQFRQDPFDVEAWSAAFLAACNAAHETAEDALRGLEARATGWNACLALLARDRISNEQYNTLMGPWLSMIGDES